jgi:DNA-binding response OmpR family regulator
VADDEPLIRHLVRALLTRQGWHVIEAVNGASALMLGLEERVDLLVTDCHMPELSGLELAARLRRARPELPVLVISGLSGVSMDAQVRGYGFLAKPFAPSELIAAIGRITTEPALT